MPKSPESTPEASASKAAPPPVLDSRQLLSGHDEILIRHAGSTYRLRRTSQDKLILSK